MPFTPLGTYTNTLRRGLAAAATLAVVARTFMGSMASKSGSAMVVPRPRKKRRRSRSQFWERMLLMELVK